MTTRITKLTPEQEATFPAHVQKWIAVGLRTGVLSPEEWATVEAAARRMYGYAGLPEPRVVLGVSSPLAGAVAARVAARVAPAAAEHFGSGVRSGVWSGVRSGIESGVRSGYQPWLHEPIRQGLNDAASHWYKEALGLNLWCSWHAFYSWFRDHGHLELPGDTWEQFAAYETMTAAAYSWWYGGFCIIADRPTVLHVQDVAGVNQLHCTDGPSITWADGWQLHHWRGLAVPADLVEGDGWGLERIMGEPNAELRRCAVERMGWDVFVERADLTPVHSAPDPGNPGKRLQLFDLPETLQVYGEPVRLLIATNGSVERDGTRRTFGITVPADIDHAVTAAAWTYDVPTDTYTQLARRT